MITNPEVVLKHPDDELLEGYLLGRIDQDNLESLEIHLLLCDRCRDELETLEEYIGYLRSGFAASQAELQSDALLRTTA